ncbi:hypothetical protein [Erythrobacter sp. HKB08]|uniref:hypothetical protein n=1 Tax=Erythrobacter sp. HKB08 TaxID=2502843 RepID=UPI001008CBA6|nr:hypothetical protein [Erythrobacter sp. HKB08]
MTRIFRKSVALAACTALVATPVLARNAGSLTDLVGARASSGESALEARGYTYITGNLGDYNTRHSYWWNREHKNCVHVETYDGRYTAITDAKNSDCHQKDGGGDVAAAVGVAAGALLLGALLGGHKKHHHDDNKHYDDVNDEAHYERGYNDGLHSVAYHNWDNSQSYSSGYQAGVAQRNRNTSYHHGRGGYHQTVYFKDLEGARASSADSALRERGFDNVDGFKSGNGSYTIWWRRDSRQCLQMITVNGRIDDIRDIGQHPKCRR